MDYRTVEPSRSGQSRSYSVRISEFHLILDAKPGKGTVMGTYMSIPYRAAICTLLLEDECFFLVDTRRN